MSFAKVEILRGMFDAATSHAAYRLALRKLKRLSGNEQLAVLDHMFAAAERLQVDKVTGLPKVEVRGSIRVRGRDVVVEVLS